MINTQTLTFTQPKLYLMSAVFVAANIGLPVLLHGIPGAGQMLLPLYFFSLVAGLKYGWRAAGLTGAMTPLLSFAISGMPIMALLPYIVVKSVVLAVAGGLIGQNYDRLPRELVILMAVVLMQLVGVSLIYGLTGNMSMATADLRLGYPGLGLLVLLTPRIARII